MVCNITNFLRGYVGLRILDPFSLLDGATKALLGLRMRVWQGRGRGESEAEIVIEISQKSPTLISLIVLKF